MKKVLLIAGCALLALSACAYSSSVVANPQEARYCQRQGFVPGTEAFDNCVLSIREAWIQRRHIHTMSEPAS